jgi:hypothetical protein
VSERPQDEQEPQEERPVDESELDDLDPEEEGEDVKGGGVRQGTTSSTHW